METQSSKHEKNVKHFQLSESFHKTILSWDAFRLPNLTENLNQVPIQFESFKHYKDIFEPLLFEETRAQITQALEEERFSGPQAAFKLRDFDATDINLQTINEPRRFVPISFSIDTNSGDLSKEDLLLISNNRGVHSIMNPNGSKDQYLSQDPRNSSCAYTLAVVHELSHNNTVVHVRTFLDTSSKIYELLLNQIDNRNSSQLNLWFAWNLTNLVTEKREFMALHSIETSPMLGDILQPAKGVLKPPHEKQLEYLSQMFANALRKKLNASQWEFIEASCACDGFVLCQGPPGTGKTTTILALLNCLHLIQFHKYYNSLMKALGRLRHQPTPQQSTGDTDESPLGSILNEMSKMNLKFGRLKQKQLVNKPRILVCTHSNGAVDELCLRLKRKGMLSNDLKPYWPDIVRVGPSTSTNQYVREVSLDHLVNVYIKQFESDNNIIKKLNQEINRMNPEINNNHTNDIRLAALYEEVYRKALDIERYRILLQYKQSQMKNPEEDLRISILNEAHIVFTTLTGSGTNIFSKLRRGFDVIIIDEAAQAVELSTMIPFMRNSPYKCIMVGDPKQLPATVISENSKQYLFTQSLFERFQRSAVKVFLLNVQYRMNPEIRKFPSKYFYEDKLIDGENVKSDNWNVFSNQNDLRFKPYLFYDVFSKEVRSGSSYINVQEAKWCVTIYQEIKKAFPTLPLDGRVGIITPYKQQMNELKNQFEKALGANYMSLVEINTVDSFQGREKDVILFSCVRSSGGTRGVGFLDDIRRMNVGLTRARLGLIVVGNYVSLSVSPHWKSMLQDVTQRNLYMRMPLHDFSRGPLTEALNVTPPPLKQQQQQETPEPPPIQMPTNTPPPPMQFPMMPDISMVPPELLSLLVSQSMPPPQSLHPPQMQLPTPPPPPSFPTESMLLPQQSMPPPPQLPPQIFQEMAMLLPPDLAQVLTPEVLASLPTDQLATLLGLISNLQQQPPPQQQQQHQFQQTPPPVYATPPPPPIYGAPIKPQMPMPADQPYVDNRSRSPNRNNGRGGYRDRSRSPDRKRYRDEKRDNNNYRYRQR